MSNFYTHLYYTCGEALFLFKKRVMLIYTKFDKLTRRYFSQLYSLINLVQMRLTFIQGVLKKLHGN